DAAGRLSAAHTLFRTLDAVADGIADEVGQRLGDGIEQALVKIGILAAHDEFHILAALFGHIAHHAREPAEEVLHRDHADLHDRTLQVVQHARLKSHGIAEAAAQRFLGSVAGEFNESLLQHRLAYDEFSYQVENAVDSLGINPQDVFRRMIGFIAA